MLGKDENNRGVDPVESTTGLNHDEAVRGGDDMATPANKRTPAFQFYPNEFLGSSKVRRMSMSERGIYITLLCSCWLDGSLPTNLTEIAETLHIKEPQFRKVWAHVLHECFTDRGGRLVNTRLEVERKKQADYRKKQKENAAKGWDGRRNATASPPLESGNAGGQPVGNALHLQSSSSSSISSSKTDTPRAQTLIKKRRMDAAWEGGRVWVPERIHSDFLGYRNGNADELLAWYADVDASYVGEIDPSMFEFWRARYREKWPASAPKSRLSDWQPRGAM